VHQSDLIRSLAAGISHVLPGIATKRTLEVRWFYEGEPSSDVVAWFGAVCGQTPPDAGRSDVYLASDRSDMNVKLRGGRLEVKRRLRDGRATRFTDEVEGLVERWDKWALPWPTYPAHSEEENTTGQWITVGKSRRLCRLEIGEFISIAGEGTIPPRSCSVELTRLIVHEEAWWSVCFEASTPEDELDGTFLRAINYAFSQHEPRRLDLAHSYGYPQWLMNQSRRSVT
jgi:hypothetical protein